MSDIQEQISELLRRSKSLPVIFAGSGLSMRYIGSPTWADLLSIYAEKCGRPLSYYLGRAEKSLPQVASMIATDFYDLWYDSPEYASSREHFEHAVTSESGPLKYEICKHLKSLQPDLAMTSEIDSLRQARAHAIITTNWDPFLDDLFPDFDTYVGQQDILFAATQGVGENYKIHGSTADPESLVLTTEDYQAYWDRNPYLVAKLMTLFAEHPIIFLGYSLSDNHIRRLLGELISCLTEDQLAVLNDRLIFVRRGGGDKTADLTRAPMTIDGHTIQIYECSLSDFSDMYKPMSELPQHFSTKLLKQVKKSVYELTLTTEPRGMIHVVNFDEDTDLDNVEVVIGVGTMARLGEKGYSAYTRLDLVESMLDNKRLLGRDAIIDNLLPTLFGQAKWCPIYYPLAQAGVLTVDMHAPEGVKLPKNAKGRLENEPPLKPYFTTTSGLKFTEILETHGDQAYDRALDAEYDVQSVLALREFIRSRIDGKDSLSTWNAKLACKYDDLVYGGTFAGDINELRKVLGFNDK